MDRATLAVSDATINQLTALITAPRQSGLIAISGPGDLPAQAATAVAPHLVRPDAAGDIRHAYCDGDRWTVKEIDDRIVAAVNLVPFDRTVVVVHRADAMEPAAAEHLLKTVEEPPAGAVIVFSITSEDHLLVTMRSRIVMSITAEPKPDADRIQDLINQGLTPDRAAHLVELCGPLTALTDAAADETTADLIETVLGTRYRPVQPAHTGRELVAAMQQLAERTSPTTARSGDQRSVPDSVINARVRTMAELLIDRWSGAVTEPLRTPTLTRPQLHSVERALDALTAAKTAIRRYVPPHHALTAALTAAP